MSRWSRRDFLQAALAAGATGLLPGCGPAEFDAAPEQLPGFEPGRPLPWRNWGGNQGCRPALRAAPETEDQLVSLLAAATGTVRPVGAGHSFSALVPSEGTLVAVDRMSGVLRSDAERLQAEVFAGTRLHQLGPALAARGQAMPNLPDIDYQTLGGAVATSTHGTGIEFGSLSAEVTALTVATPRGELVSCDRERNAELFHAGRCSLGALGVVSRMTLQNQPAMRMRETTRVADVHEVLDSVASLRAAHRHFEFFAFPHTRAALTISTDEADASVPTELGDDAREVELLRNVYRKVGGLPGFGDWLYERLLAAGVDDAPVHRTGPSHSVLTHVRLSRFREMEYTVPAEAGPDCLREILAAIVERRIPIVFPIEYRYVKGDDIWLSMFHERDGCSISLHQYADQDHRPYFDAMEPIFWKYEGRPHWGKLHSLGAEQLARRYPRFDDFRGLRAELDPEGRMLNDHLAHVLGARPRV